MLNSFINNRQDHSQPSFLYLKHINIIKIFKLQGLAKRPVVYVTILSKLILPSN